MTFFSPQTDHVFSFVSPSGSSGTYYVGGFYDFSSTSAALTQASTTQTYGTANISHAAHASIVASGAGTTDGSDLVLTVTGTSITDAGVRTTSDSEVIVADCTAASTNGYYETAKKWIGTITFTLSSTGGATFAFTFNYGFAKYNDFENQEFHVRGVDVIGRAGANDSGFDIELLHHHSTGWTYAATGFVPGDGALAQLTTDHSTESDLAAGESFAWKRTNLDTVIAGNVDEGVLFRITTTANKAVESSSLGLLVDIHSWAGT